MKLKEFMKSQVMVLIVLALLLAITPLLPSSLRPTYLYFIFNVLIIALGAEAGLLSAFSKPAEDRKQPPQESVAITEKREASSIVITGTDVSEHKEKKHSKVNNEVIVMVMEMEIEMEMEEIEVEEEIAGVNGQELFAKAEAFIGNFYKQLKMQREESLVY